MASEQKLREALESLKTAVICPCCEARKEPHDEECTLQDDDSVAFLGIGIQWERNAKIEAALAAPEPAEQKTGAFDAQKWLDKEFPTTEQHRKLAVQFYASSPEHGTELLADFERQVRLEEARRIRVNWNIADRDFGKWIDVYIAKLEKP